MQTPLSQLVIDSKVELKTGRYIMDADMTFQTADKKVETTDVVFVCATNPQATGGKGHLVVYDSSVIALTVMSDGENYDHLHQVDVHIPDPKGGLGAEFKVRVDSISSITPHNSDQLYDSTPIIVIDPPQPGGIQATAKVCLDNVTKKIMCISMNEHGSGYISPPKITIISGDSSRTVSCNIGLAKLLPIIVHRGSGYVDNAFAAINIRHTTDIDIDFCNYTLTIKSDLPYTIGIACKDSKNINIRNVIISDFSYIGIFALECKDCVIENCTARDIARFFFKFNNK